MEIIDAKKNSAAELSELFHYYVARNNKDQLSAIDFREGFQAAIVHGVAPRKFHPYPKFRVNPMDRKDALKPPSQDAIKAAENYKIAFNIVTKVFRYYSIPNFDRVEFWKKAIQEHNPVIFAFYMTDAYLHIKPENPNHGVTERMVSSYGHAVVAIGYDDQIKSFHIKDSRGASFGKEGSWWLSYALVETNLVIESWVIEAITTDE